MSALERTVIKKVLTYMGMQEKERIARIGSFDPGSHLGIPFSHVSANNFRIDVTKSERGKEEAMRKQRKGKSKEKRRGM